MYDLLSRGALGAFCNGRVWFIPKEAVKNFIMEQEKIAPVADNKK